MLQKKENTALKNLGDQHDIAHYAEGMKFHLNQKLSLMFLINDPGVSLYLDVGCATGDLLAAMYEYNQAQAEQKKIIYVGLDLSEKMIEEARRQHSNKQIIFTTSFEDVSTLMMENQSKGGKSAMVLSSVLHEVLHYQPLEEQKNFWSQVWNSQIDYVAIRDFCIDAKLANQITPSSSVDKVRAAFNDLYFPESHPFFGQKVLDVWEHGYDAIEGSDDELLKNKFSGWGSIERCDSFVHFLMTFEYLRLDEPQNYLRGIRELRENYMVTFDSLCNEVPTFFTPRVIKRGMTENRKKFMSPFFETEDKLFSTKAMMCFQKRRSPEEFLEVQDNVLKEVSSTTRILRERCIHHLVALIQAYGSAVDYLKSTDTEKNPNLDRSMTL